MKLTWRDSVTTLLVVAIFGLYNAVTRGVELPFIGSLFNAIVAIGLLAVVMGAIGLEERDVEESGWLGTLMVVGLVIVGLMVASFFYTSQTMLLAVTIGVGAMWVIGMTHHIVSESDHVGAPV